MRVKHISVEKLFGRFDHPIPMNQADRITIIHALNGFGKTTLLRLIAGVFSQSDAALVAIPFQRMKVEFDSGETLCVSKDPRPRFSEPGSDESILQFVLRDALGQEMSFVRLARRPEEVNVSLGMIEELIPELDQIAPRVWRHLTSGEVLSLEEVLVKYGERLPLKQDAKPDWLNAVRQSVRVSFIQTERLSLPTEVRRTRMQQRPMRIRAVQQYADELGTLIKQKLTEYGALSQTLDRSFPVRILRQPPVPAVTSDKLDEDLKAIEARRSRLVEAGLLTQEGETGAFFVPPQIDPTQRAMLAVYAKDAQEKLSVFDDLVQKVELFKNSINQRFLYKRMLIGTSGFSFETQEHEPLDPASLSSGEQHEIVLLYQLLFRVQENSLILIDEPEISLHVAWQEQFLSDLKAITELSHFDVLIATHSPQIISDQWDITVQLVGPAA